MTRQWGRESTLWNRLFHGESRNPVVPSSDEKAADQPYVSEKTPAPPATQKPYRRILNYCLGVYVLLSVLYMAAGSCRPGTAIVSHRAPLMDFHSNDNSTREVIGVAYPFIPKRSYGEPVHSQLLVDHVFDSWRHPELVTFTPPKDVAYNKVVLTLNTTVGGRQYDRLAHIYVGGAEIWRTSTMEPGSRHTFSSYKKDVSSYVSLFQNETQVLFQLDNVVSESLTGAFHVVLHADFYLSEGIHSENLENSPDLEPALDTQSVSYKYFDIRKPADAVHALVKKGCRHTPPVEQSDALTVLLPRVPHNTTRLKLAIFASGNGDEEFWYNNVLDSYTDVFGQNGLELLGHGPLRFVNVWVNGEKFAVQAPQPFIFTGGYAPSLWSPVVGVNAFDLPSIDLDVTGLLPLLWENDTTELRISVDNGVDELEGTSSGIGSDWILSANLLTYESPDVVSSSGKVLAIESSQQGRAFGVKVPVARSLQQVSNAQFDALIVSELLLELKDGQSLNVSAHSIFQGTTRNLQSYEKLGEHTDLVHIGQSSKKFMLVDNTDESVVHATTIELKYPLALALEQTFGKESDLNITLAIAKETYLEYNGKNVMTEINKQNGTSSFHVREGGNYGTGRLDTRFKSIVDGGGHQFKYTRKVSAADGQITADEDRLESLN